MRITKSIVFSSLIVGALSTTQTDVFARGAPHGHGERPAPRGDIKRPDNSALKEIKRADDSKYHAVLNHPEEREANSRSATSSGLQAKGPEDIKVDDGSGAAVSVDGIGETGVTVADSGNLPVTVGNIGQEISINAGSIKGYAQPGKVGAAHPESQTQENQVTSKSMNCYSKPSGC